MPKKMTVLINDQLDKRFREAIFKTKGMYRGNITEAVEEAIELWIKERYEKLKREGQVEIDRSREIYRKNKEADTRL